MAKILDRSALIVSALTSPVVVATVFALIIIAHTSNDRSELFLWGSIFFLLAIIFPTLFILIELKIGKITDFHIMLREQRTNPFIFSLICTALLTLVLFLAEAPLPVFTISLILLINGLIFFIITCFWKISIHLGSFSCSILTASFIVDTSFLYLYAVIPLIIWARMRRHRHSIWQGLSATALGSAVTLIILQLV